MGRYEFTFILYRHLNGPVYGFRTGTQALPAGSVPVCVIDAHRKTYFEIVNDLSPEEAFTFLSSGLEKNFFKEEIPGKYRVMLDGTEETLTVE
ncbi:MAG: hypothetical protein PHI66_05585 [Candidatus Pacebacteria bacterium]|nr:hypothetical protein [Candidatus Paceibacterota bacterium]